MESEKVKRKLLNSDYSLQMEPRLQQMSFYLLCLARQCNAINDLFLYILRYNRSNIPSLNMQKKALWDMI